MRIFKPFLISILCIYVLIRITFFLNSPAEGGFPYSMTFIPSTGNTILSDHINTSNNEHINNNIPESIDDFSVNVSEMQAVTDPYPASTESLATTLDGEIQRLRNVIKQITQETQWYFDPPTFCEDSANYNHGANNFTGSGAYDFGSSTASLEIPNDAAITVDKIGELALDTTITGYHQGLLTYFGTETNYIVSFPTDTLTTNDGDVAAYNAERDQFEMVSNAGFTDSAGLANNLSDETGTDTAVFSNDATLVRPTSDDLTLTGSAASTPDANTITKDHLIGARCTFNGQSTPAYIEEINFSGAITDNGVGDYTLTIDRDFANDSYAFVGSTISTDFVSFSASAVGSIKVDVTNDAGAATDRSKISIILVGAQ